MRDDNSPRSILRVMTVLKCFTSDDVELTAAEISRKAKIPRTTTYRILSTLTKGGMLERNPETDKYTIGPALYAIGSLYLSTTDLLKAAEPVVKALNELTSEGLNVGIFDDGRIVLVMREEASYTFKIALHIGSGIPSYASSMGKAILSELSDAEIDSLYREERLRPVTKKTITTKTELKEELKEIRKTGVAFNWEGAYEGVIGIASVIRGKSGSVAAAMGITVPVFRIDQKNTENLAKLVKMGCSLISYRLGYQERVNPVHSIDEIRSWWKHEQTV